jgi:hypothetical protein
MENQPKRERRTVQFSLCGLFCVTLLVALWAWGMRERFATVTLFDWLTAAVATTIAIGLFLESRRRNGDRWPPPVAFPPNEKRPKAKR